jgi:fumarate hydratase class II
VDIARPDLVTALSSKIGYDKAAETAHTAYQDGSSLREACGEKFDAKRSAKLQKIAMSHHQYLGMRLVNQVK